MNNKPNKPNRPNRPNKHAGTTARRPGGGFTLVEMTIVIGIVILLAGLTLAVSVSVVQGSEVRQTELTIRLLDAAIQEWEAQADRQITYGIEGQPYNQNEVYEVRQPDPLTAAESAVVTKKFMAILLRSQGSKQILAQIDPEFARFATVDHDDDTTTVEVDTLVVSDAWGNALFAVLPGRVWVNSDFGNFDYFRNPDGTIQTATEKICGVVTNRQVCFVSSGPDEQLGDLDPQAPQEQQELARDNRYSYPPAPPQVP